MENYFDEKTKRTDSGISFDNGDYLKESKQKQKRYLFLIIIIAILCVTYFLYTKRALLSDLKIKNNKSVDHTVNTINNLDKKWIQYNNSKFYFSFNYPTEYRLTERKELPDNILSEIVIENKNTNIKEREYFSVSIKEAVDLEAEIYLQKQLIKDANLISENRTARDGLAGMQLEYEPIAGKIHNARNSFTIIILGYEDTTFFSKTVNNYYTYILRSNIDKLTYREKDQTKLDKIFSTFKQIPRGPVNTNTTIEKYNIKADKTFDKTQWKKYVDSTYNLEFNYPADWKVVTGTVDYSEKYISIKGPDKWITSSGWIEYPSIDIGNPVLYSTSGALCLSCDSIGILEFFVNGSKYDGVIYRGYSNYNDDPKKFFDYYRLGFENINLLREGLHLSANFGTKHQGQLIANILSTINNSH